MGFVLFERMARTFRSKVSVRRNGHIGFSKGTVNKFDLTRCEFCELYYDKEKSLVGFKFTNDERKNVTAKIIKRGQDMFISCRAFLNFYGIDFKKTRIYLAQEDEESGFLYIDLKNVLYESKRKE